MRTKLGVFFETRSVNRANISRKTGISNQRLSELSNNNNANIRADELYLIAKALDISPCILLELLCDHLNHYIAKE